MLVFTIVNTQRSLRWLKMSIQNMIGKLEVGKNKKQNQGDRLIYTHSVPIVTSGLS